MSEHDEKLDVLREKLALHADLLGKELKLSGLIISVAQTVGDGGVAIQSGVSLDENLSFADKSWLLTMLHRDAATTATDVLRKMKDKAEEK